MSLEDVAYATRTAAGGWVSVSYVGRLERGEKYPSMATISALATALDVEPTFFPQYRLAAARRLLDEREVGLDQALENLSEIEAGLAASLEAMEREVRQVATEQLQDDQEAAPAGRQRRARARRSA